MSYLRDWVYGGIDGVVIIFVIVVGFVGVGFLIIVILIFGVVNLLVDGFFMVVVNYSGLKLENEDFEWL